ncbi:Crp/Fnr family transcriptional regulator [uncultured Roseobacter sp.]|uniref:Crp/Fnr family transcriptional regulator n=1 Tax=uncultured Roseobacter sp. TaxID=114847 RepID=UPI0026242276|nr:Crp/Fnr family transcriptional regulator [uncultured Roseobacter sp.]
MIVIMWQGLSIFDQDTIQQFDPGDTIFRVGSAVKQVFLVCSGRTVLVRPMLSGEPAVLQRASSGHIIAEASVYAQRYHCDCVALESTQLAHMSRNSFLEALRSDTHLAEAWASYLAHGVQQARMHSEIRSLRTVAQRLDAWITEYGELPEKGQWQGLAYELSVSREALYRELARRRSE